MAAPRIHHQALPDRVFYEPGGLSTETREKLTAMGYALEERKDWIGDIQAISRADSGGWVGVADPRRGGGAAGVDANQSRIDGRTHFSTGSQGSGDFMTTLAAIATTRSSPGTQQMRLPPDATWPVAEQGS